VYEAIAALPENFQAALVAVDVVGLRYREAARSLRIREATLTTRLFRARQKVAQALGPAMSPAGRFPQAVASSCS
jgi:DNA-directed RNA polymerase specialized sigma24 family protein